MDQVDVGLRLDPVLVQNAMGEQDQPVDTTSVEENQNQNLLAPMVVVVMVDWILQLADKE